MTRSDRPGVGPTVVEEAEIVGMGGGLYVYRLARAAGSTHAECVEIVGLGGDLYGYREARAAGSTHAECVEVVGLGGSLFWYREARRAGVSHATVVDAVTVHGLPAGLLRVFAKRMSRRSCSKQWPVLGDPRVGGCGFRGSGRRIVRCGCRDGVRTSPVRQGCLWDRKQVGTRQAVGW